MSKRLSISVDPSGAFSNRVLFLYTSILSLSLMVVSSVLDAQNPLSSMDPRETPQSQANYGYIPLPVSINQKVTVSVKDSTLGYTLRAIANQAGLKLWYDKEHKIYSKRVTVKFSKTEVMDAFQRMLKGTGFTASLTSDGQTIVVRPPVDRDNEPRDSVGSGQISGRVIDSATGKPVKGATVTVVGEDIRAISDDNGGFIIRETSRGDKQLQIRLIGYRTGSSSITVVPGKAVTIDVKLVVSATSLSEVVTTAIGSQRRVEVGNDIVKLNAAEILEKAPARSVSEMLRYAQVPGVQVLTASGNPGAPTRIRMRGIGSISQNADPAIIVDGVWVNSDMSSKNIENMTSAGGGYNKVGAYASSPLDEIDPSAIESIEILRGPSAASLYGQEAANGVIVITTKRGKVGQTSWTYRFSRDWDSQVRSKFGEWVAYGTKPAGGLVLGCDISRHSRMSCIQDSVANLNQFGSLLDETGPAANAQHNLAVRGGIENITYSLSATYKNELGTSRTVPADLIKLRKLNIPYGNDLVQPIGQDVVYLSSSFGFSPDRNLNFDLSVNASNTKKRQNSLDIGVSGNFLGYADTLAILDHQAAYTNIKRGGSDDLSVRSGLTVRYMPASWWNASGQLGIDIGQRTDRSKKEERECRYGVCAPFTSNNGLERGHQAMNVMTGRLSVTGIVATPLDRFVSLRPSIGLDFKHNRRETVFLSLGAPPFGADGATGAGSGTIQSLTTITAGYYVNTTVRVLDRMNFDLGWRQDAGSAIRSSVGSRYPKLATSWLVSDEEFFPKNPLVTHLRLRGAMGYAAVHPDVANLYGSYAYDRAVINGQETITAGLQTIGNKELLPERSLEFEGGFDMDMFTDRMTLVFTMAHKVLRNAIITRRLPTSAGIGEYASRQENVARVDNRSVEVSLNARIIDNDAMLLNVNTSMSTVNNVIRRLGDRVTVLGNTSTDRLVEGYQVGSVWQRPILGYGDADQNGFIDNSEILLGDTTVYKGWNLPKFSASYQASLSILQRSLTFSMSVSQGGTRIQQQTYHDNYGEVVVGAPLALQAIARANAVARGTAMQFSDVRLMSGSINYTLPSIITRRVNAKLISVSLQGSNLGLWTNYSGRDPLVNSTPVGNVISDNGFTLPLPKRYAVNFRVEL